MISLGQMLLCLFGVPYSKRNATPLRIMLKMFLKKNILYYSKLLKRFRIDSGELFGLLYVTTHDHPPVSNLSNASGDLVTTTTSTLLLYIYILLLYIYIYIFCTQTYRKTRAQTQSPPKHCFENRGKHPGANLVIVQEHSI